MDQLWLLTPQSLATLAVILGTLSRWLYGRWRGHRSLINRAYRWAIVQARLRWANDQLRAQIAATEADRDWWATLAKECAASRGMSVSADGLIDVSGAIHSPLRPTPQPISSAPNDASD